MDKNQIQLEYEYLRGKSYKAGGMGILISNGMASWIKFTAVKHNRIIPLLKKRNCNSAEVSKIDTILTDSFLSGNL